MSSLNRRLAAMMFLEFFVWGAWYVTVGNYMTAIGLTDVIYWAYTVSPIAAVVSPFFLGMVADRFFATERVLGVLHILGGLAMLAAPSLAHSETLFILALLLHVLFFMPTLGLTNSLAFHHITDQEKQFPVIRVFGTIGWIGANVIVSAVLHADATPLPLYIAGAAGILLGLYSFTLPHTPPPRTRNAPDSAQHLGARRAREALEQAIFRLRAELASDQHPTLGVLRLRSGLRELGRTRESRLQDVVRPNVGSRVHGGDAVFLRAARRQVDARRRYGGPGYCATLYSR